MKGEDLELGRAATVAAIRARRISSREAVEAALQRLHSVNPAIDAVVEILGDEALAAAEQADSRLLRGRNVRSTSRRAGDHQDECRPRRSCDHQRPGRDEGRLGVRGQCAGCGASPCGAIIIGRTNIPAFSYRWFTGNDLHGITRNPWDPKLSPGG